MKRLTLNAKEAAEILGISYWLILELAKKGGIPHVRAGNRVLFRESSLLQWLDEQETNSLSSATTTAEQYGMLRRIEV
jgi:excisionase family DNA binding protein